MTVPTRHPEQAVQVGKEGGVVNREWEGDMSHVTRTVHIIEPTSPTQVLLAARSHGRVVEAAHVGVEQAVKRGGVGDLLEADALDLLARVDQKLNSRQPERGSEARV